MRKPHLIFILFLHDCVYGMLVVVLHAVTVALTQSGMLYFSHNVQQDKCPCYVDIHVCIRMVTIDGVSPVRKGSPLSHQQLQFCVMVWFFVSFFHC